MEKDSVIFIESLTFGREGKIRKYFVVVKSLLLSISICIYLNANKFDIFSNLSNSSTHPDP